MNKLRSYFNLFLFTLIALAWSCATESETGKVYESSSLTIQKVGKYSYVHTAMISVPNYGDFPCNGLIFLKDKEAIVVDTPPTDSVSNELIAWINEEKQSKVKAVIPSHFHEDCLGGLKAFHDKGIPSLASKLTQTLAKADEVEVPLQVFDGQRTISLGGEQLIMQFIGEGHTKDNCVAFIPSEQLLFGGCLVKEINAPKGYLGDANMKEWSNTIRKIKKEFPSLRLVIPGHGKHGGIKLLDYTAMLFQDSLSAD